MSTHSVTHEQAHLSLVTSSLAQAHLSEAGKARLQTVSDVREARDAELILRVRSGDTEAFYTLIRPYLGAIHSAVRSLVGDAADTEDIVQDAILRAFSKLHQLRSFRFFRAWLIQIAVNEARMMWRTKHRTFIQSLSGHDDADGASVHQNLEVPDWRNIPSFEMEKKQIREMVWKAVAALPGTYRKVFMLRIIQQLSTEQTAETLGLNVTTAKTRLRRARLRLRKRLSALWANVNRE
jgi:RNA polymerase sigma-70 factor, ECF subfamily